MTTASDNFQRPNSTGLGANWAPWSSPSAGAQIVSDAATALAGPGTQPSVQLTLTVTSECNVLFGLTATATLECNVGEPYQGNIQSLATDRWYPTYPS